MYASCIIHICIMATCIRIKNICIIHPTPRIALFVRPFVRWSPKSTASYIHTPPQIHASSGSWNRIIDLCIVHHTSVHHTYMHQGEGSRIIDICIMHTCIRKHHIYTNCYIVTCIIHSGSGTRIIHRCIMHTYTLQDQGPGSLLCASYTHVSGSMIEEHRYMHHTCMYQDQASWINASYICASWPLVSGSIMYASYIQTSGSRIIHSCMLQDQGSWICVWIYTSYIVNHTHMHQDQGY